jgi:hypothetical protein
VKKGLTLMESSDILTSLRRIAQEVNSLIGIMETTEPEGCSCHERDSSQVCDVCYKQGYRGHMQESHSRKCDDCYLWSNSYSCDFCGKAI